MRKVTFGPSFNDGSVLLHIKMEPCLSGFICFLTNYICVYLIITQSLCCGKRSKGAEADIKL